MISRIEAYKYRCFERLDIKVGQYQVLAGTNGSGKSTLLDIPLLLGEILNKGLISAFFETKAWGGSARARSFRELIYFDKGDYFGFVIEAILPSEIKVELENIAGDKIFKKNNNLLAQDEDKSPYLLRYELCLEVFNNVELQVKNEFLYLVPKTSNEPELEWGNGGVPVTPLSQVPRSLHGALHERPKTWFTIIARESGKPAIIKSEYSRKKNELKLELNQLALANIPRDLSKFPATIWLRDLLEKGVMFYEPNWGLLRQASPPVQIKTLKKDASNLPWMVLNLQQEEPDLFNIWVDHVRMALPNLISISAITREDDFHAYLKLKYQGDYEVTSSGLSYGTLQILGLTILPYLTGISSLNNMPKVMFLEEPENGIHPRAIEIVLQSLSSVYDAQIWISTHSPVVLAHTNLDSIIVMQSDENGGAKAILGSEHPRLKNWQGTIDLGSLFAAGVLS
ncbi:AAA family ATPase [Geminocystis sp.]|uniref:methylation-associated defense system AAA family ATPase MAD3 n=1 Tax=Geminocystis sp. TaxID=2664100 RepID=UPI003594310C